MQEKSDIMNSGSTSINNLLQDVDAAVKTEQIQKRRKRRTTTIKILIGIFIVVAIIVAIVVNKIIVPTNQYNQAISLRNSGNMEEAYPLFIELGNFKDSKDICNEYEYQNALIYLNNGQYAKAYSALIGITGYEAAENTADQILEGHPYVGLLSAEVGTEVIYGYYEQDNDFSNGTEDIEWIVLAHENGNILLVSKYILDAQMFNTQNTHECTVDDWLMSTFYDVAFEDENLDENILYLSLFSIDDALSYMTSEQQKTEPTTYAKSISGFTKGYAENYYYWLGGHTLTSSGKVSAYVARDSYISSEIPDASNVTNVNGIRPVMWVCPDGESAFPEAFKYSGEAPSTSNSSGTSSSSSNSGKKVCSRCDGTGKVTKHFGYRWNQKEGYRYGEKCGACGGTGYID